MPEPAPITPPPFPPTYNQSHEEPLTDAELAPIRGFSGTIEALLRRPRGLLNALAQEEGNGMLVTLVLAASACALLYGLVVGAFSGGVQYYAAPLKIAGGLLVSAALCLPSLYVFGCLSGSTARIRDAVRMLAGTLALALILLFSFAPVAWVFSQSTNSVGVMGLFHVVFWLVAISFGGRFLLRGMRRAGARSEGAFYVWLVLFVLVSLQMATALRPIVGTAPTWLPKEKKFFMAHWAASFEEPTKPGETRPQQ